MEFLGKSHLRLGEGRDWLMLEILVARVEVVPKVIPLIIIHKPVVALARLTRALHGTRVRVRGGRRATQEDGRGKVQTVSEISVSFTRRDEREWFFVKSEVTPRASAVQAYSLHGVTSLATSSVK
jgi:hypothetical protein